MKHCFRLLWMLPVLAAAEPVDIAVLPAKIVPEQATTLSLEAGMISDLADETQHQERGAVIAVLNKERTEQEREEMELQIARDSLSTRDEIRKLQAQRAKVSFYLGLSEKEKSFAAETAARSADDAPPTAESLRDIDERLSLLRRQAESAPRIRRNEFRRTHEKLTLRMPFSGRLQYGTTLPQEQGKSVEYVPMPGQAFATVCDDSAFYITIHVSRADLTQIPPERLSVFISLPEGKRLVGRFDKKRVERATNGNGDMLVYFFRLPEEEHDTALAMLGSHAEAHLVYDADPGTLIVSKTELVMRPESAECSGWEELAARLYPQHVLVLMGERTLVLRPKE